MKYDDASWHYGGDFPADLPQAAGATHIGLFLSWMLLNGHGSDLRAAGMDQLRLRAQTPGAWFLDNCDEKLAAEDLSEEGNRFAAVYYLHDEEQVEDGSPSYLLDYMGRFPEHGAYQVPDNWESYDRLAPILAHRFALWRGMEKGRG